MPSSLPLKYLVWHHTFRSSGFRRDIGSPELIRGEYANFLKADAGFRTTYTRTCAGADSKLYYESKSLDLAMLSFSFQQSLQTAEFGVRFPKEQVYSIMDRAYQKRRLDFDEWAIEKIVKAGKTALRLGNLVLKQAFNNFVLNKIAELESEDGITTSTRAPKTNIRLNRSSEFIGEVCESEGCGRPIGPTSNSWKPSFGASCKRCCDYQKSHDGDRWHPGVKRGQYDREHLLSAASKRARV